MSASLTGAAPAQAQDGEIDAAPRRTASVTRAATLYWLVAFIAFEWLRTKLGIYGFQAAAPWAQNISALELSEIYLLSRMTAWRRVAGRVSAIEALTTWAATALAVLAFDGKPIVTASLLAFFVLARFVWSPDTRLFALGLTLFLQQSNPLLGAFGALHNRVASFDGFVLRHALRLAGQDVTGVSSVVYNESANFGIDILSGCASSMPLIPVLTGFVLTVLALRRSLAARDLAFSAGLVLATFVVNWLRLAPAALSKGGYAYWHDGGGASIVAAAYAALAVGVGYGAARAGAGRAGGCRA